MSAPSARPDEEVVVCQRAVDRNTEMVASSLSIRGATAWPASSAATR